MGSVLDTVKVPAGFYESLRLYEDGLFSRLAAGVVAEAEAVAADDAEVAVDENDVVWLGAESWTVLVWELLTILKALELVTAGMWVARGAFKAPVSSSALYLASMALVAGEFAGRFAERKAKQLDDDDLD